MHFYRRMLKAFANDEAFDEELPDRNEMINSYTSSDSYPNFDSRMNNINDDHYKKTNRTASVSSEGKYSINLANKLLR